MRDRIVAGINNHELHHKLLQEKSFTFQRAKTIIEEYVAIESTSSPFVTTMLCHNKKQNYGRKDYVHHKKNFAMQSNA